MKSVGIFVMFAALGIVVTFVSLPLIFAGGCCGGGGATVAFFGLADFLLYPALIGLDILTGDPILAFFLGGAIGYGLLGLVICTVIRVILAQRRREESAHATE